LWVQNSVGTNSQVNELQERYKRKKIFDCSDSKDIDFANIKESPLKSVCYPKIDVENLGDAIPANEEILNDRLDPVENEDDFFGDLPTSMITVDPSAFKAKWTPEA
jgi:hypothetical protein